MVLRLVSLIVCCVPLAQAGAPAADSSAASTSSTATVYDLDEDAAPAGPTLDPKQVSEVVGKNGWAVSDCYSRNAFRGQSGRMTVEFHVKGDGSVPEARLESSDLKNTALESCVVDAVKRMRFPALGGPETITTFPFIF